LGINFHKIFSLVLISAGLGILINTLNPNGIDFIRKERILVFENDSLLVPVIDSTSQISKIDSAIQIKPDTVEKNIKNKADVDTTKVKAETDKEKEIKQDKIKPVKDEGFKEPKAITLEQAYKLYNQGIVFIDARESEEYKEDHILNAVSIPFYEYEENAFKLDKIKKDQPIVVYCAGTDCDLSIMLGDQLFDMGYKKTYIFFGGWNEWTEAKYPTISATKNDSTNTN
jgi:rhodanese-related sulfurtransferase